VTNIAVIGVGALGKRHLQSLTEFGENANLYAVENNESALAALKKEFNEDMNCNVSFVNAVELLPKKIDLVVIATSSNVRRMLFEKLTEHAEVGNVIFEKVLFQRAEDYVAVQNILEKKKIKAWVNCARREWDFYHELKKIMDECNSFTFSAIGGQWGMACNGIHMLDLVEFLAGESGTALDISNLLPYISESKRKGFFEVFGSITGSCRKCHLLQLTCLDETNVPFMIEIVGDKARAIINEGKKELYIAEEKNNWAWEKRCFEAPFQSQLTYKVAKSILESGDCRLANYQEAMELHLKFIGKLIPFFEKQGMEEGLCPIT